MNMDMCTCTECNVSFKVSDCTAVFGNHNGWELPPYNEHYCPNCDGLIENYFYSDDAIKALNDKAMNDVQKSGRTFTYESA